MERTLWQQQLCCFASHKAATWHRWRMGIVFAVTAIYSGAVLPAQPQSGISDLGKLTIPPFDGTDPRGISDDGSVVVGIATNGLSVGAVRWTQGGGITGLGSLGGYQSAAYGVSADGSVVVGSAWISVDSYETRAFRWTQGSGMVSLGTLAGGNVSAAYGVSADGSVVVGSSTSDAPGTRAFRWTEAGGMVSLGTLDTGTLQRESVAYGVSADGSVVVGAAINDGFTQAFRWTKGSGMVGLGTVSGRVWSSAYGVSTDGSVVVGEAAFDPGGFSRAFRWTQGSGMVDLGTLGGYKSVAKSVSADGRVVVGTADVDPQTFETRAFRWTQATGMQSVEKWLRAAGVAVASDTTESATSTNHDGSIVVGRLINGDIFIARVVNAGSGLMALADVQDSLGTVALAGHAALSSANMVLNGAHSRPLDRRVAVGQKTFWLAGDWGRDDHGTRNGSLGLAEAGFGYRFGAAQVNLALGQTWAQQNMPLSGKVNTDGSYLLAEALIPVTGNLWATIGGYRHWGGTDLTREYLNAGVQDYSKGTPNVDTWAVRTRLDWEHAARLQGTDFSPYADLSYHEAKLDAFTETGGGFPAHFDARKDKATELRLGTNALYPLTDEVNLLGTLEAAHRFENKGARTSGELIGLFGFKFAGLAVKQDWLRASIGLQSKVGGGMVFLSLNDTTQGAAPNVWLEANWLMAF